MKLAGNGGDVSQFGECHLKPVENLCKQSSSRTIRFCEEPARHCKELARHCERSAANSLTGAGRQPRNDKGRPVEETRHCNFRSDRRTLQVGLN
jgi:hypothetical protein